MKKVIALAGEIQNIRQLERFLNGVYNGTKAEYKIIFKEKHLCGRTFDKAFILGEIDKNIYRALKAACRGTIEFI